MLTAKPVLYVCNVEEAAAANGNAFSARVGGLRRAQGAQCVVISAAIEAEVAQLASEAERREFLATLGLEETGLARVIRAGYRLLDLVTFFTVGPKEAHAWTVRQGAKAPQAAGVIHTDFEKGFIRAETISYADFVACGGETQAQGSRQDAARRRRLHRCRTATSCICGSISSSGPGIRRPPSLISPPSRNQLETRRISMGEMISLTAKDGFKLGAYLAKPNGKPKGAIVVIQEIFGVNHHIKAVSDRFAAMGYAAVAPALFDRVKTGIELGYDPKSIEEGRALRPKIPLEATLADTQAAIDYAKQFGKVAVVGYCWGGSIAFLSTTRLDGRRRGGGLLRRHDRRARQREAARAADSALSGIRTSPSR